MRANRSMSAVLAVLGVLLMVASVVALPSYAAAQMKLGGGLTLEGGVEVGGRVIPNDPPDRRRQKLEEYRDINDAPFLNELRLRLFTDNDAWSFELGGTKWGQSDQEFTLGAGRIGLFEWGFAWDELEHIYSTNSRTLETEVSPGKWQLPTPRPNLFLWNTAPLINGDGTISQQWDTARTFLQVTPTPDLDVRLDLTRIKKDGQRPFGIAMASPGGNFLELVEPIDQTVTDLRLRATFARDNWQIQAGYVFSMFQNENKSLTVDNPCFGLTAAVTAGGCAAGATTQRSALVALPPDNMAHTFSLAGGINLPMRTRISANLSYGVRLQNESFVGHTVNPAISSPLLALPQDSLEGFVGIGLINLNATTQPIRPLTLSLKYRMYDFHDTSDEPHFPAHVINDQGSPVIEDRTSPRFGYTRHNLDADAKLRIIQPLAFTIGGGWERWDRVTHREAPTTDEYFAKAALDWTIAQWLTARLSYRPSWRRVDEYSTFAHLEHTVVEETAEDFVLTGQSVLLRKFDEAERDRQRVDLLLTFMPLDTLTATIALGYRNDNYVDSPMGLTDQTEWSAGFDIGWTPFERLGLFAGYTREMNVQKQQSRSRQVGTGSGLACDLAAAPFVNCPDYDWISVNTDTVNTIHFGANIALLPKTLDLALGFNYSTAVGEIDTRNIRTPTTTGPGLNPVTATAKRMPAFEDTLVRIDAALRYHFWRSWTASLGYAYESFTKTDWRTDTINPFQPAVGSSIYLGHDTKDYDAHIVGLTVGYRF